MIKYKIDILEKLKTAGFNTNVIRKNKLLGQATMTRIRSGKPLDFVVLSRLCALLNCQPGDLLEYVPDGDQETAETETADN